MPAQVELIVLLAVIAGGVAYVVVRVRRGALDEARLRQEQRDEGGEPQPRSQSSGSSEGSPATGDDADDQR